MSVKGWIFGTVAAAGGAELLHSYADEHLDKDNVLRGFLDKTVGMGNEEIEELADKTLPDDAKQELKKLYSDAAGGTKAGFQIMDKMSTLASVMMKLIDKLFGKFLGSGLFDGLLSPEERKSLGFTTPVEKQAEALQQLKDFDHKPKNESWDNAGAASAMTAVAKEQGFNGSEFGRKGTDLDALQVATWAANRGLNAAELHYLLVQPDVTKSGDMGKFIDEQVRGGKVASAHDLAQKMGYKEPDANATGKVVPAQPPAAPVQEEPARRVEGQQAPRYQIVGTHYGPRPGGMMPMRQILPSGVPSTETLIVHREGHDDVTVHRDGPPDTRVMDAKAGIYKITQTYGAGEVDPKGHSHSLNLELSTFVQKDGVNLDGSIATHVIGTENKINGKVDPHSVDGVVPKQSSKITKVLTFGMR